MAITGQTGSDAQISQIDYSRKIQSSHLTYNPRLNIYDDVNNLGAAVTAKSIQGTGAMQIQNLQETGRTFITMQYILFFAGINGTSSVETVLPSNWKINKGGVITTAQASYTVTSGKTFRIQSVLVVVNSGGSAEIDLQIDASGTLSTSSSIFFSAAQTTIMAAL